jgi:hypothetical protein
MSWTLAQQQHLLQVGSHADMCSAGPQARQSASVWSSSAINNTLDMAVISPTSSPSPKEACSNHSTAPSCSRHYMHAMVTYSNRVPICSPPHPLHTLTYTPPHCVATQDMDSTEGAVQALCQACVPPASP